jgi:hypothetical protein
MKCSVVTICQAMCPLVVPAAVPAVADGEDLRKSALPICGRRTHIESLDGIRGLAVILVLAVHFQITGILPQTSVLSRWLADVVSWGWCGVENISVVLRSPACVCSHLYYPPPFFFKQSSGT